MRILFVQKDLYERSIGGSEFFEHHLARTLRPRHELRVLCTHAKLDPEAGPSRRTVDGVPIVEVAPNNELYPGSRRERAILTAFGDLIDEFAPEVVHVQDLVRLSPEIPRLARRRHVPVVHTLHEFYLICPRLILRTTEDRLCTGPSFGGCARCGRDMARSRYVVTRLADEPWTARGKRQAKTLVQQWTAKAYLAFARRRQFLRAAQNVDLLLCPTAFLRDRLCEAGIPSSKMRIVRHGLPDLGEPRPKTPARRVRFAFIGTLAPHKGIFVLLEAARAVADADFTIYGPLPSPIASEVRRRVAELPNVKLAGALTDEAKAEAYASIDALVVPSIWYENPSISILEAFHFRTPVVTSRLGGMKEIVEDGGGWLVAPEDHRALAEVLFRLSREPAEMTEVARSIPAVPSIADQARLIEAIYAEVAHGGNR